MRGYFERIIGNEAHKKRLGTLIESGHIPHALLLCGAKGTGKLTLAKEIAAAVNCENKGSSAHSLPCHRCNTCRRIAEDKFLDVKQIRKNSDKVTFGVDDIRFMIDDMMLSATESDYKIYIFPESHLMTAQAQNALLKILEEPPEGGMMILLSEEEDKILTTIKSRVQTMALQRFSDSEVDAFLTEHSSDAPMLKKRDPIGYFGAISASGGALGQALELMNESAVGQAKEELVSIKETVAAFLKKGSYIEKKAKIAALPQSRNDLAEYLEEMLSAISELICFRYDKSARRVVYRDDSEALALSSSATHKRLVALYDLILDVKNDCRKNANISALLSGFAAKISTI